VDAQLRGCDPPADAELMFRPPSTGRRVESEMLLHGPPTLVSTNRQPGDRARLADASDRLSSPTAQPAMPNCVSTITRSSLPCRSTSTPTSGPRPRRREMNATNAGDHQRERSPRCGSGARACPGQRAGRAQPRQGEPRSGERLGDDRPSTAMHEHDERPRPTVRRPARQPMAMKPTAGAS